MGDASKRRYLPPCRVCGDRASGLHYGVNTCEACKGFYRRSFARKRHLKCKTQREVCSIRFGQNNCSFCRYQKCVQLGMCKEAIKIGRYTNQLKANNIREVVELSKIDWPSALLPPSNGSSTAFNHVTLYNLDGRDVFNDQGYIRSTPTKGRQGPDSDHLSIIDLLSKPTLRDVMQSQNETEYKNGALFNEIDLQCVIAPTYPEWHTVNQTNGLLTNQLPAFSEFVQTRRNSRCQDVNNNHQENLDFDWLTRVTPMKNNQFKMESNLSIFDVETELPAISGAKNNVPENSHSLPYSMSTFPFQFAGDEVMEFGYDFCDTALDQNWGVLVA